MAHTCRGHPWLRQGSARVFGDRNNPLRVMQRPVSSRFQALVIVCSTKKTRYGWCRRGRRVARSFQQVGGGKRWLATVPRQPVCKGDLEFMGVGARTGSIFHAKTQPCPAASGTVTQMAPPYRSKRFRARFNDESSLSVHSAGGLTSTLANPTNPPPSESQPPPATRSVRASGRTMVCRVPG